MHILNVRLLLSGEIPTRPSLLVANHVSWLDIFVINSLCPSRFVAKSEIRDWRVLGWLTAKAGTFFLQREKRADLKEITATLTKVLENGQRVAIFPEGTTTGGDSLNHFHASMFDPAVRAQVEVIPVALRFTRADGSLNHDAAFVGETTFWESLRQVVAEPQLWVTLHFARPLSSVNKNRRELARAAEQAIASALARMKPETTADLQAEPRLNSLPTRSRYQAPRDPGEAQARALTSGRK